MSCSPNSALDIHGSHRQDWCIEIKQNAAANLAFVCSCLLLFPFLFLFWAHGSSAGWRSVWWREMTHICMSLNVHAVSGGEMTELLISHAITQRRDKTRRKCTSSQTADLLRLESYQVLCKIQQTNNPVLYTLPWPGISRLPGVTRYPSKWFETIWRLISMQFPPSSTWLIWVLGLI